MREHLPSTARRVRAWLATSAWQLTGSAACERRYEGPIMHQRNKRMSTSLGLNTRAHTWTGRGLCQGVWHLGRHASAVGDSPVNPQAAFQTAVFVTWGGSTRPFGCGMWTPRSANTGQGPHAIAPRIWPLSEDPVKTWVLPVRSGQLEN